MIIQVTNLYFMTIDTLTKNYRNTLFYYPYMICWLIVTILMFIGHKFDKPHLYRICCHIVLVRNIVPWYNFEDRKTFDDIGKVV